jgi:hypothetical protein
MSVAELIFEGQTFRIARRSLVAACELFLEDPDLLKKPYRVLSGLRKRISGCSWRRSREQ